MLIEISRQLSENLSKMSFPLPIKYVYDPTKYAREPHENYLKKYGLGPKEVVLVGMNPGPWGMAQTGVPFGEISFVKDWLKISGTILKPKDEHPKRPITGFECHRSEVSGARLWGWAKDSFGSPEEFFKRFYVANYCPLSFMIESGANFIPEKLPKAYRDELFAYCDKALRDVVVELQPKYVIGIGAFAESQAKIACDGLEVKIGRILHPSPASPIANKGWAEEANKQFEQLGIII